MGCRILSGHFAWLSIVALYILSAGAGCSTVNSLTSNELARSYWVYVGGTSNTGIHLYHLDTTSGALSPQGIAAPANGPGFFAISPSKKFMYAVDSIPSAEQKPIGGVEGFSINRATGILTPINNQPSHGEGPCFVTVDPQERNVLVTNYTSATAAVYLIDDNGKLASASCVVTQTGSSTDPVRQTHAYAHSINLDAAGKYAFCADLGADKLFIYHFDSATGKLTPNDPPAAILPPGSGPRHMTFSHDGKFAYVVNEMGATVVVYSYDADKGALTQVQIVPTLRPDFKGTNTSAEVQIHPSGKFLYASNRLGTNYLTIFAIDQATGKLTLVGYQPSLGRTPRNFRIDPTGTFMIVTNQDSNNIVMFRINPQTGELTQAGSPINVPSPTCVKFLAIEPSSH
jgi:6-phosphogluconolactonase